MADRSLQHEVVLTEQAAAANPKKGKLEGSMRSKLEHRLTLQHASKANCIELRL